MFDARSAFAATTLFLNPPLLYLPPEPFFSFRRSKHCKAHSYVAGHILQPLNLGVAETAAWRGAPEDTQKSIDLHGHSHGRLKPLPRQFDVGVDAQDLRPVTLDVILNRKPIAVREEELVEE